MHSNEMNICSCHDPSSIIWYEFLASIVIIECKEPMQSKCMLHIHPHGIEEIWMVKRCMLFKSLCALSFMVIIWNQNTNGTNRFIFEYVHVHVVNYWQWLCTIAPIPSANIYFIISWCLCKLNIVDWAR